MKSDSSPSPTSSLRRGLYVIGLTGNIATGKSTVAKMLTELGARVIDADALAHQVMKAGTPAWHQIVEQFGRDILQGNGEIDRTRLGARAFAEPAVMERLEAIVHPAVIAEAESLLQAMHAALPRQKDGETLQFAPPAGNDSAAAPDAPGGQVAVLEAIKLIESGMHHRCDELWVVTCPREQQVQRLMETRSLSQSEAELRIDAQPPQSDKIALASVVIDNGGGMEDTREQVQSEWERILRAQERAATEGKASQGGRMSVRQWVDEHPFLSMWAILAVGMIIIFLITARNVELLLTQRLFMALACVALAGLCTWIVSWE